MLYTKRAVDFVSIETLINLCYNRLAEMGKTFRYFTTKQISILQKTRIMLEKQLTSMIELYHTVGFWKKFSVQKKIKLIKAELAESNRQIVTLINTIIGYVSKKG